MLTQAPKGTKDVLPRESYLWQYIEAKMRAAAALAGFREVRTPVFEHTELFLRGVGDTTDIVQKEMYTFKDKGDRSITLKPEGTAGAVRAFVEGKLYAEPLPYKMYYLNAPIFRYEKPQAGRYREHHQFGMEVFGAKAPTADAELMSILYGLLTDLGLKNLVLHINSIGCPTCRPAYHAALKEFLGGRIDEMCPVCRERFDRNPLRVLDCKEEKCKEIVKNAPVMVDMLCEDCKNHFDTLQRLLAARGIPFVIDSHIVRGLDYYTKTVFEVVMQSGREGLALCGGGRYDGLVEELGGPACPAVGFGIGTERILLELTNQNLLPDAPSVTDAFVAPLSEDMRVPAFSLMCDLRAAGVKADTDHAGRSLKAQFKFADKLPARLIVILGGDEWARGTVRVRDLKTGEEQEISAENAVAGIKDMLEKQEEK